MTHLTVHEWGRIGIHNGAGSSPDTAFTRSQANALLRAARSHSLANRSGTNILIDRYNEIWAQQIVGVIAAPGCSCEILPKIDSAADEGDETIRSRLISMLDVALGLKLGDGHALAMARQKETLLDILIRLFADRLRTGFNIRPDGSAPVPYPFTARRALDKIRLAPQSLMGFCGGGSSGPLCAGQATRLPACGLRGGG